MSNHSHTKPHALELDVFANSELEEKVNLEIVDTQRADRLRFSALVG
jgi:hypothetical protein